MEDSCASHGDALRRALNKLVDGLQRRGGRGDENSVKWTPRPLYLLSMSVYLVQPKA